MQSAEGSQDLSGTGHGSQALIDGLRPDEDMTLVLIMFPVSGSDTIPTETHLNKVPTLCHQEWIGLIAFN